MAIMKFYIKKSYQPIIILVMRRTRLCNPYTECFNHNGHDHELENSGAMNREVIEINNEKVSILVFIRCCQTFKQKGTTEIG